MNKPSLLIALACLVLSPMARAQPSEEKLMKKAPDRLLALAAYRQVIEQMAELQKKLSIEQAYYNATQASYLDYLDKKYYTTLSITVDEQAGAAEHTMRYSQKPWDNYLIKQQLIKDITGITQMLDQMQARKKQVQATTLLAITNLEKLKSSLAETEEAILPLTEKPSMRKNFAQTAGYLTKAAAEYDRLKKEKSTKNE